MFRGLSEGSGVLIVVLVAAIGLFLLMRAVPALARNQENFFTYGGTGTPPTPRRCGSAFST